MLSDLSTGSVSSQISTSEENIHETFSERAFSDTNFYSSSSTEFDVSLPSIYKLTNCYPKSSDNVSLSLNTKPSTNFYPTSSLDFSDIQTDISRIADAPLSYLSYGSSSPGNVHQQCNNYPPSEYSSNTSFVSHSSSATCKGGDESLPLGNTSSTSISKDGTLKKSHSQCNSYDCLACSSNGIDKSNTPPCSQTMDFLKKNQISWSTTEYNNLMHEGWCDHSKLVNCKYEYSMRKEIMPYELESGMESNIDGGADIFVSQFFPSTYVKLSPSNVMDDCNGKNLNVTCEISELGNKEVLNDTHVKSPEDCYSPKRCHCQLTIVSTGLIKDELPFPATHTIADVCTAVDSTGNKIERLDTLKDSCTGTCIAPDSSSSNNNTDDSSSGIYAIAASIADFSITDSSAIMTHSSAVLEEISSVTAHKFPHVHYCTYSAMKIMFF